MKSATPPIPLEIRSTSFTVVKKRSDKIVNYFLACYFATGLILAFFYDTWAMAFCVGSLCLLAFYTAKKALPDSDLYQYVLSVVLGIFMAQFIYQMHGLFEMHFFAFIGSAILITYQNWKLQIPMLLVVVIHHVIFGYLQNVGLNTVYFTQLDYFELQSFIIHFVLAAIIFFICGLWAYQLKKYSELQTGQALEMEQLQQDAIQAVSAQKEQLEQHVITLDKAVARGKFEIASDVMHDIGNAVVGFGSYLTKIRRLQNEDAPDNLKNLADFFENQKSGMAVAIGETKANAVIKMLYNMSLAQRKNQADIGKSITDQLEIITHIQEILSIQRQYITGHGSVERAPVNLRNIINDSLAMVFASLDRMDIAVTVNIATDLPIIKGDRTKLMQAMLNILKNSIEAMDVSVKEKTISVIAKAQDGQVIIHVKDNGKGFEKAIADEAFKRGFTTNISQSGLGLYNCRSILESHDGTIQLKSDGPGKGCLTIVTLKAETIAA